MHTAGTIGPNAILRVAEALPGYVGADETRRLFDAAGVVRHLDEPPTQMVAEEDVRRLHDELRRSLGTALATSVARDAGRRTGDYLLGHRIPGPLQTFLHALPAGWAARVLLKAIRGNAWTFCGSGHVRTRGGRPAEIVIASNPLCAGIRTNAPACEFYAATFERLARALVDPHARVRETECAASGGAHCRFEMDW